MARKNKKTKRSKTQYPGLEKNTNRVNLRDVIDFDYVDKLSPDEKAWLDKFSTEYYSADFRPTKTKKTTLHKSKSSKRKIYRDNNSRNQDTTSYLGNFGAIESYNDLTDDDLQARSPEDALNAMIDLKKKS